MISCFFSGVGGEEILEGTLRDLLEWFWDYWGGWGREALAMLSTIRTKTIFDLSVFVSGPP